MVAAPQLKPASREKSMSTKKTTRTKTEAARKAAAEEPVAESPAEPKARTAKTAEKKPKKVSAIDAAARVLGEAKEPMNCQEMIKVMADKGYWTSPGGKTPSATLYSAITREMDKKGKDSRFKKTERGRFTANS
jgi:hypothetical protein